MGYAFLLTKNVGKARGWGLATCAIAVLPGLLGLFLALNPFLEFGPDYFLHMIVLAIMNMVGIGFQLAILEPDRSDETVPEG